LWVRQGERASGKPHRAVTRVRARRREGECGATRNRSQRTGRSLATRQHEAHAVAPRGWASETATSCATDHLQPSAAHGGGSHRGVLRPRTQASLARIDADACVRPPCRRSLCPDSAPARRDDDGTPHRGTRNARRRVVRAAHLSAMAASPLHSPPYSTTGLWERALLSEMASAALSVSTRPVSLRAATASQRAPSTMARAVVHSVSGTRSSLALGSRTQLAVRPVQATRVARVAARRAPAAVVAMAEASKDKTVLVVGATGYIGRFVTKVRPTRCGREDGL
jgi:hypothetical protein